jgi:hypothetical protein
MASPETGMSSINRGHTTTEVGRTRLEPAANGVARAEPHRDVLLSAVVLVREPHTQRRQRLIRPIPVSTVRIERRHDMGPAVSHAQVVVPTGTTALDGTVVARLRLRSEPAIGRLW